MIRGTTPTLQFTLPIDAELLQELYVTISQAGTVVVEKTLADCEAEGIIVVCRLTQADTLALQADVVTEIQVRVKLNSGDALASRIISVRADRILKDGEI